MQSYAKEVSRFITEKSTVLEVAPGPGYFAIELAKMSNYHITGMDISPDFSERRFYQKITDIYATALDYDKESPQTRAFFAKVQNKMHYAVHGHTAAELIYHRADS